MVTLSADNFMFVKFSKPMRPLYLRCNRCTQLVQTQQPNNPFNYVLMYKIELQSTAITITTNRHLAFGVLKIDRGCIVQKTTLGAKTYFLAITMSKKWQDITLKEFARKDTLSELCGLSLLNAWIKAEIKGDTHETICKAPVFNIKLYQIKFPWCCIFFN